MENYSGTEESCRVKQVLLSTGFNRNREPYSQVKALGSAKKPECMNSGSLRRVWGRVGVVLSHTISSEKFLSQPGSNSTILSPA